MNLSPAGVQAWARGHEGMKFVKYSMVSVVSVIF